jgi:capsule polysaccharide export protein KpsC/LpsZ
MASASCVLILAGVYNTYSRWINIEKDLAKNTFYTAKRIITIEVKWNTEHQNTWCFYFSENHRINKANLFTPLTYPFSNHTIYIWRISK